jgi:hypothetical protein
MRRGSMIRTLRTAGDGRNRAIASVGFGIALGLTLAGCGEGPQAIESPSGLPNASAGDDSVFRLPPGFKPVDIPLIKRKEVFKEAHEIRALAVQEANRELPMDEASLPVNDTAAFDKRVADHRAIIGRILAKNLASLAEKSRISVADVEKIEEEAGRLRWLPPQDPTPEGD